MKNLICLLALILMISGCVTTPTYRKYPYLASFEVRSRLRAGKIVAIGMSKEDVKLALGEPDDINRSVYAWGTSEQWIYGDFGPYLYFDDDKLTSWQD